MSEESFFARWSRRKQGAAGTKASAAPTPSATAPALATSLPPLEELTFASDYSTFMQANVPAATRRAALKKLFADAHFNQLDRLDIHMEDYNLAAPLSAGLLSALQHVPAALRPPEPDAATQAAVDATVAAGQASSAPESE